MKYFKIIILAIFSLLITACNTKTIIEDEAEKIEESETLNQEEQYYCDNIQIINKKDKSYIQAEIKNNDDNDINIKNVVINIYLEHRRKKVDSTIQTILENLEEVTIKVDKDIKSKKSIIIEQEISNSYSGNITFKCTIGIDENEQ